jgi:hypothetical protein
MRLTAEFLEVFRLCSDAVAKSVLIGAPHSRNVAATPGGGLERWRNEAIELSLAVSLSCVARAGWWPVSVLGLRALGDRAKRPVSNGGAVSIWANLSLRNGRRLRLVRRNFNGLRRMRSPWRSVRARVREREAVVHRAARGGGPPAAATDREVMASNLMRAGATWRRYGEPDMDRAADVTQDQRDQPVSRNSSRPCVTGSESRCGGPKFSGTHSSTMSEQT